MELTPRLKTAYELLGEGETVIDVGSDHGYLTAKLLFDGKYKWAVVSDINSGPLKSAMENLKSYKLDDRCDFALSDGLVSIMPPDGDYTVAICGMGGELIAKIMSESHKHIRLARFFVLQPMTKANALRYYLWNNGFEIVKECAAAEGDRIYTVMSARYTGEATEYRDEELHIGKREAREASRDMLSLLERIKEKTDALSKIVGKNGADVESYAAISSFAASESEYLKELLK